MENDGNTREQGEVSKRMEPIRKQVEAQYSLAKKGYDGSFLRKENSRAYNDGAITSSKYKRNKEINKRANSAKHNWK